MAWAKIRASDKAYSHFRDSFIGFIKQERESILKSTLEELKRASESEVLVRVQSELNSFYQAIMQVHIFINISSKPDESGNFLDFVP